jgi:hypothetical protein
MPTSRIAVPRDVELRDAPPSRVTDSTLGISVTSAPSGPVSHPLVAVGDSLTHGFKSLGIKDTALSYPAMIARELRLREFRYPLYDGPGGLPLDLEWLLRELETQLGPDFVPISLAGVLTSRRLLEIHEDHWERGAGRRIPHGGVMNENLGIYGWDLRDVLARDADCCRAKLKEPRDNWWPSLPEDAGDIAALRVLDSARGADGRALTPLEAAARLGEDGIETLIVWLGANNVLPTVLTLDLIWSGDDYADLDKKHRYTAWRPTHFAAELNAVVERVRQTNAQHVLWLTIPHVTIAPIARGFGDRPDGSLYYEYYGRPWVDEDAFLSDPRAYPHLVADEARAIDSAIDQYNAGIGLAVRAARTQGLDWHLVDVAGVLDSLAYRRFIEHPTAQPPGWEAYELPPELVDELGFRPDTRFLKVARGRVAEGGLVSLDGLHPTTVGYGIVAQECIGVMHRAGVLFPDTDGTARAEPGLDFRQLARTDTLLAQPLSSIASVMELLGMLDDRFALVAAFEKAMRRRKQLSLI